VPIGIYRPKANRELFDNKCPGFPSDNPLKTFLESFEFQLRNRIDQLVLGGFLPVLSYDYKSKYLAEVNFKEGRILQIWRRITNMGISHRIGRLESSGRTFIPEDSL